MRIDASGGASEEGARVRADIGIALDGDADRVLIVDEEGAVIDGDQLMAVIADSWAADGMLKGGGIAATVMSNLGLERYLQARRLKLQPNQGGRSLRRRADASGRPERRWRTIGHIVLSDFGTTGDGLVAALQILAVVKRQGKTVSEICRRFEPVPQV